MYTETVDIVDIIDKAQVIVTALEAEALNAPLSPALLIAQAAAAELAGIVNAASPHFKTDQSWKFAELAAVSRLDRRMTAEELAAASRAAASFARSTKAAALPATG